ncbi:MAG: radical SAM protein [Fervidobacterium gondwanense]
MVLRASYWTWKVLSGEKIPDEMPTAYLMLDGKCMYNCLYCTHASLSSSDNSYLSRVVWKVISLEDLRDINKKFKRICVQTVNYKGYKEDILSLVKHIRSQENGNGILVSVSTRVKDFNEIDEILNSGVDQLGVAIDVVSEEHHKEYRSWPLSYTLSLIEYGARKYNGRITTHIIVGLGENDKELNEMFIRMKELGVEVALFAFTPVRGTALENLNPPSIERYRKIQLLRYLIFENSDIPDVEFDEKGYIKTLNYHGKDTSKAFLTSGCTHCTRPYYNDSPRNSVLYNYHSEKYLEQKVFDT